MSEGLPNLRFERKFVAAEVRPSEALALVRRHPALFRSPYPPRWINNLYLDTPDLRHFHDHVEGAAHRVKTRIRWYGPLRGPLARPVLERKLKRGLVSGKGSYPLPPFALNGHLPRPEIARALAEAPLPEPLRWHLQGLQPALVNRYHRHYFVSANGHLRLTVDTELECFDARSATGRLTRLNLHPPGVIIELKYPPEYVDEAAAAANVLPFRMVRCSKYVLGVEHFEAA
jgi:hypothetical protein